VKLQTNFPSFTEQQQEVTSLPVSLQIILEAANPVGAASTTAAINPKIASFIESPPFGETNLLQQHERFNQTVPPPWIASQGLARCLTIEPALRRYFPKVCVGRWGFRASVIFR
jgi:hypothetical protein